MKTALVTLFSLVSTAAFAAEEAPSPSATPVAEASAAEAPATMPSDHSFGVHIGANVGLFMLDGQAGHFYGFAAGNAGIPLLSNGDVGFGMMGAGYTFALSAPAESMWYMDVLALGTAGKVGQDVVAGGGLGVGFRYLHRSGFTFEAKVPVFGATAALSRGPGPYAASYTGSQSVANFYLASLVSLPAVSLGYRF